MKRFTTITLSVIILSLATTTSVKAATRTESLSKISPTTIARDTRTEITPFELVSAAYQGEYHRQGIPGFGAFLLDARTGKITAKQLVQVAIDNKQLSPAMKTDRGYLNAVEMQMRYK
jgi:hypothetical protein